MSKDNSTFTARDFELLTGAFKCLKSEPIVDYVKFAARHNFKNSASAKASWHALKKKIDRLEAVADLKSASTPNEASTGNNKRTVQMAAGDERASGDSGCESEIVVKVPVKKGKKAPTEKTKTPAAKAKAKAMEAAVSKDPALPIDTASANNKRPVEAMGEEEGSGGSGNERTLEPVAKKGKKAPIGRKTSTVAKDKGKKAAVFLEAVVEGDTTEDEPTVAAKE